MTLKSTFALSIVLLTLAACGGGPSDGDVKEAYKKLLKASPLALMALGMGGGGNGADIQKELDKRVNAIEVLVGDKTKQGDGSYMAVITVREEGASNTISVHMLKGADGWVIADR